MLRRPPPADALWEGDLSQMRNGNSNCQANRAATNASGAARFFTPGRGWRVSANRLVKLIRAVGKLLLRGGFGTNADPAGMGRVVVGTEVPLSIQSPRGMVRSAGVKLAVLSTVPKLVPQLLLTASGRNF